MNVFAMGRAIVRVRLRDREYIGDITDIVSLGVVSRVDRCIIGKPVPLLFHLFPNKRSALSLSFIHPMSTTPTSSPSRLLASGSLGAPLHVGESGSFLPDAQSTIPVTPVATSTFVSFEQASTGVLTFRLSTRLLPFGRKPAESSSPLPKLFLVS